MNHKRPVGDIIDEGMEIKRFEGYYDPQPDKTIIPK